MLRNSAYVLSKLILKLSEVFEIVLSTETVCCYKTFASQGFFERFDGFVLTLTTRYNRSQGRKAHFRPLQRQAYFHPEI